jgi:hypothetical protein
MEGSQGRDNIGALDSKESIVCGSVLGTGIGYHCLDKAGFLIDDPIFLTFSLLINKFYIIFFTPVDSNLFYCVY